jgi:DNA invertase Pin-like site-specific DNA recombinase
MVREFKPRSVPNLDGNIPFDLPIDKPVAIYYRQSTMIQVGNISTSMQTIDMRDTLIRRGWSPENIIMIDMDAGVSGTTKIEEREGMRRLFDLITGGHIAAVACQDEDRLFRDVTQIQVNIFIEACRAAQVQVITPSVVYLFHHPNQGDFYRRQFRFKSEMAAEYLSQMKGRMHRARQRLMYEGRFAGFGGMPTGYMVDNRKEVNGLANPNYKKYVPYEPFAEYIRTLFKIFLECEGNAHEVQRVLYARNLPYPDMSKHPVPPGHITKYKEDLTRCTYPHPQGIDKMMTQPAYIGHWAWKGEIIVWNNHEPIVPEDLFFAAFNMLSPYSLDGSPNPNFRKIRADRHPAIERSEDRPLFDGIGYLWRDGTRYKLGCEWRGGTRNFFNYSLNYKNFPERVRFARWAEPIDDALVFWVHRLIRQSYTEEKLIAAVNQKKEENGERQHVQAQIINLERAQQDLVLNLAQLTLPSFIAAAEKRYAEMETEKARLQSYLHTLDSKPKSKINELLPRQLFETILNNWENISRADKRRIILSVVNRFEIVEEEAGKTPLVDLFLNDGTTARVVVFYGVKNSDISHIDKLKMLCMMEKGATLEDLIAEFSYLDRGVVRRVHKNMLKTHASFRDTIGCVFKTLSEWSYINTTENSLYNLPQILREIIKNAS